ncbi:MAG: class I SAM-dependent methyltransferase [Oscillospiraceae bacterium]|nr:class I SAM-dependent methyltransferase [Oscillospiraceae bacterium]MDD7293125.1 class I SAM-dependent methyltransferase [Clostridiaceae bacterium]MDY5992071.1 class I SAM-dependent methyltransferase [Oscillospiraceae bacterium]
MRSTFDWKDYELIDCSDGERLERWNNIILIRPDPQVIWKTPKNNPLWKKADAVYHRSKSGGGAWEVKTKLPPYWSIDYKDLTFNIKTMGFKHTGIFPEQAVNWDEIRTLIREAGRPVKVLNLFAYTGGATVACLKEGASVVHVDASKGMVAWAKENAASSSVADKSVRWIVDDCIKFVQREIRRGNRYDIIIMDPPSYGRGPGGEVWKLEDEVYSFVELCSRLLYSGSIAVLINSYTTGLSPSVMQYILGSVVVPRFGGKVSSSEIGLPVTQSKMILPCGASAFWKK